MLRINRSVLKLKNNIGLILCLICAGCIWWVPPNEDRPHRDTYYNLSEMWFEEVDVYCEYNAPDQWSNWTFVTYADTTEGPEEIDEIYVDIVGSYTYTYNNSFRLTPYSYGMWSYSFQNHGTAGNSYYCGSSYEFQFTAYDYWGNYITTWYDW